MDGLAASIGLQTFLFPETFCILFAFKFFFRTVLIEVARLIGSPRFESQPPGVIFVFFKASKCSTNFFLTELIRKEYEAFHSF